MQQTEINTSSYDSSTRISISVSYSNDQVTKSQRDLIRLMQTCVMELEEALGKDRLGNTQTSVYQRNG